MTAKTRAILTLDPGLTTGWAYFQGQSLQNVGSIKFTGSWLEWLDELKSVSGSRLDLVVFEELLAYGVRMNGERFKFEGLIEFWCEDNQFSFSTMHPGTVKKFITGAGNCKKADLRRVLKDRIEIPNKSNQHIVDAVATGVAWLIQNTDYVL